MKTKVWTFLKLSTLLFFTCLMLNITVPYLSLKPTESFLQIKQWVINNDIWRVAFFTHVFSSIFLLIAGFTQFFSPINKRFSSVHRTIGKMYITIVLFISGPAGFIMSLYANGGLLSEIAFTILSVFWITTTTMAWKKIQQHDFIGHGNYMIRSYALTLSALTLRAWKYIMVMLFHPHPMDVYMIVAWLGWIPNLIIGEIIIKRNYAQRVLKGS
jgi:hypothetical protein